MPTRTNKRGNGEGSIQRLPDGAWRAVLTIGTDPTTGKQLRRSKRASTRTAAAQALKHLQERYRFLDASRPQTLGSYLHRWLESTKGAVRSRTYDSYSATAGRHVIPVLGSVLLDELKPLNVQALLDRVACAVSPTMANYVRTVLNIALNEAVRWQVLDRNPVVATRKKKTTKRQPVIWQPDEVRRFLAAAHGHRLYALFYLVLTTGLRHGELLGLTWRDVEADAVIVRRTVSTRAGMAEESEPKSASGRRIVAIDPTTRTVLEEHRVRQREEMVVLGMADPSWTVE